MYKLDYLSLSEGAVHNKVVISKIRLSYNCSQAFEFLIFSLRIGFWRFLTTSLHKVEEMLNNYCWLHGGAAA